MRVKSRTGPITSRVHVFVYCDICETAPVLAVCARIATREGGPHPPLEARLNEQQPTWGGGELNRGRGGELTAWGDERFGLLRGSATTDTISLGVTPEG